MYRCSECGSGYSIKVTTAWRPCPRCLERTGAEVPLHFELNLSDRLLRGHRGGRRARRSRGHREPV